MDVDHVDITTWTDLHIRPAQYTNPDDGLTTIEFRVEVRVDAFVAGRGTGRSLGAAIVAAGMDMMGVNTDLLITTMDLLKEKQDERP